MMITIFMFLTTFIIWQENFNEPTSALSQLYDYHVDILQQDGKITLTANPQFEGFASAWLYVDKEISFCNDDALEIRIRTNENVVRIRYFLREKCHGYYAAEEVIDTDSEWQDLIIPLKRTKVVSGTEFPTALTPGKNPALYLFIENGEPGNFDVQIDQISIVRRSTQMEER
jgi:hypothetical protein